MVNIKSKLNVDIISQKSNSDNWFIFRQDKKIKVLSRQTG